MIISDLFRTTPHAIMITEQLPYPSLYSVSQRLWNPHSILLASALALLCLSRAGAEDAGTVLNQIQNQLDKDAPITQKTFDALEGILEKNPRDYTAHLVLGSCYDKVGLPDLATEQYRLSADCFPNDARAVIALVKSNLERGQVDTAMRLLEAASKRFPNDSEVLFWSGNYLLSKDRMNEAKTLYTLALERNRSILGLPSALGEVFVQEGRYGDAVRLARQDLSQNFRFWLAYKVKGFALLGQGKYEEAREPLQVAYEHMTYKTNVARNYAYACSWLGRNVEALGPALINLAVNSALDSDSDEAKKLLYGILRKVSVDDTGRAIAETDERMDRQFKNPAYHFALGDVLDKRGWFDLAIAQYEAGLRLKPDFARGIFRLGKDLELHRAAYEDAMRCYEKAHALSPDDREIAAYLRRLESRLPSRNKDLAWQLRDWLRGGR